MCRSRTGLYVPITRWLHCADHQLAPMCRSVTQVAPAVEAPVIRLEAQRGDARVKREWPLQAADACGAWLRERLA